MLRSLHNLKNVKHTHGGVLHLVNLQAEACNFTRSNNPPWVLFTFFKLHFNFISKIAAAYKIESEKLVSFLIMKM